MYQQFRSSIIESQLDTYFLSYWPKRCLSSFFRGQCWTPSSYTSLIQLTIRIQWWTDIRLVKRLRQIIIVEMQELLDRSFPKIQYFGISILSVYGSYFLWYIFMFQVLQYKKAANKWLALLKWNPIAPCWYIFYNKYRLVTVQWSLSVTTTAIIKSITCDLFSNVF